MKRPVMREPKLTAKGVVTWEEVSKKVRNFDEALQKRIFELERRMEMYDGQQAVPQTASSKSESRKRENNESGSESSGGMSNRNMSRPGTNIR